jgi:hypothetical protein
MLAGVARRSRATSEIVIPAVPALLDHYVELLDGQFASLGRRFSEEDLVKLRGLLLRKLDEGFRVSPHSTVHVRYHTDPFPSVGISYAIAVAPSTVEQEYALWTTSRKAPLFGMSVVTRFEGSAVEDYAGRTASKASVQKGMSSRGSSRRR